MKRHIVLSLSGALNNWKDKEWKSTAAENGMTPKQLKKTFEMYVLDGKKVIPFGGPCEGFNYETGCPGHPNDEIK